MDTPVTEDLKKRAGQARALAHSLAAAGDNDGAADAEDEAARLERHAAAISEGTRRRSPVGPVIVKLVDLDRTEAFEVKGWEVAEDLMPGPAVHGKVIMKRRRWAGESWGDLAEEIVLLEGRP